MNPTEYANGDSRREFLRTGVRRVVLTGLAAVSALLLKRSGGKLTGQTCVNRGICSGCAAFSGCGLPAALSAKVFETRSSRREETQTPRDPRRPMAANSSQRLLTSASTNREAAT